MALHVIFISLIFDARTSESLISAALTLEPNYWIYESEVRRNEGKKERRQKEYWRGPGSNIQPSDYGPDALPLIHGGLICGRVKSEE